MSLNGIQIEQIHEALMNGYRSHSDLSRMVRINLDISLNEISTGKNLSETAFDLVNWADSRGKVSELIQSAYNDNPSNPKIRQLALDASNWANVELASPLEAPDENKPSPESANSLDRAAASSDKPNKKNLNGVIIAVIGVLATIIVGYWQFAPNSNNPQATPSSDESVSHTITYIGSVIDADTEAAIRGAKVSFEFQGTPPIVYTDGEGTFRLTIDFEGSSMDGRLKVEAEEYNIYDRFVTISDTNTNIEDIRLNAISEEAEVPEFDRLLIEGYEFLIVQKLDEAESRFNKARGIDSLSPDPWYWKSRVAKMKENVPVARLYIERALQMDKNHPPSIALHVELLLLSGGTSRDDAKQVVNDSYGISADLNTWFDCLIEKEVMDRLVITNSELNNICSQTKFTAMLE